VAALRPHQAQIRTQWILSRSHLTYLVVAGRHSGQRDAPPPPAQRLHRAPRLTSWAPPTSSAQPAHNGATVVGESAKTVAARENAVCAASSPHAAGTKKGTTSWGYGPLALASIQLKAALFPPSVTKMAPRSACQRLLTPVKHQESCPRCQRLQRRDRAYGDCILSTPSRPGHAPRRALLPMPSTHRSAHTNF